MRTPGDAVNITPKSIGILTLISAVYLLLAYWLIGFKSDEVVLVIIVNSLFYLSPITRKFILAFAIFVVYWVIFDFMKALPNYRVNPVHIAQLYQFDKDLFGIPHGAVSITANEYWIIHQNRWLDLLGGIFYLCWIPVPLAFAVYLFFTRRPQYLRFALTFFTVNMLGFIIYYLYPAAPPWYVQLHGFEFIPNTPGNVAGLIRFDHLIHADIFQGIYKKGSNVFAAMPSLHSSYPVIVLYYGIKNKLGRMNLLFATVALGIWFTAVYASHHYVTDVLSGIVCAIVGIVVFNRLAETKSLQALLTKYAKIIS